MSSGHSDSEAENKSDCCSAEIKALFTEWIENRENTLRTKEIADKLIPLMEACGCDICKHFLDLRHSLVKKSQWIFGRIQAPVKLGNGWDYDIGFGGLDHVLASGEDVCRRLRTPLNRSNAMSNVVVVDTEVYSCQRLRTPYKDKSNEVSNVIKEASILRSLRSLSKVHWTIFTYHGPSLSLRLNPRNGNFSGLDSQVHWTCSYATPLQSAVRPRTPLKSKTNEVSNHGIKIGMGRTQSQRPRTPYKNKAMKVSNEEKKAVECGYWHLWHYNPAEEEAGKNGFHLDSKEPDWSKLPPQGRQPQHRDFIMGEVRYCRRLRTPVKIKQ